jgi:hypothetical protein
MHNYIILKYSLSDRELSKMTLKYLGPQVLVSRNIIINNINFWWEV